MKPGIHPEYVACQVTCACGNSFTTRSTKPVLKLEICSACHPFFTGRQKLVDTAGRVDRFQKRFARTGGKMVERKPVRAVKVKKLQTHQPKGRVLSTAPKKAEKPEKKAEKKTDRKS